MSSVELFEKKRPPTPARTPTGASRPRVWSLSPMEHHVMASRQIERETEAEGQEQKGTHHSSAPADPDVAKVVRAATTTGISRRHDGRRCLLLLLLTWSSRREEKSC